MERDAVPGEALHVRHVRVVIEVRAVVGVLLEDGEDARWRFASFRAGRNRRLYDPTVGVIEGDLLRLDGHDRHDWFAGIARRRLLGGAGGLFGGGPGA